MSQSIPWDCGKCVVIYVNLRYVRNLGNKVIYILSLKLIEYISTLFGKMWVISISRRAKRKIVNIYWSDQFIQKRIYDHATKKFPVPLKKLICLVPTIYFTYFCTHFTPEKRQQIDSSFSKYGFLKFVCLLFTLMRVKTSIFIDFWVVCI